MRERPLGDDIRGLRTLAVTLCGYLPEITGVSTALNQEVSQLTSGDPTWRGPAAAAFTAAWRRDADTAQALAVVIAKTAAVVGDLATELSAIQAALEREACTAARYGVEVGTDMRPRSVHGDPAASAADASERHRAQTYRRALADAQRARSQAAGRLSELYAAIIPGPEPAAGPARPPGRESLPVPYRLGRLSRGRPAVRI